MYVCMYVCMHVCMYVCLYLVIYSHYQSLRTYKVSANNCSGPPRDFVDGGIRLLMQQLPDLVTGIHNTAFCWKNSVRQLTTHFKVLWVAPAPSHTATGSLEALSTPLVYRV